MMLVYYTNHDSQTDECNISPAEKEEREGERKRGRERWGGGRERGEQQIKFHANQQ